MYQTTEKEEQVAKNIVDAAFVVHKTLGPGLLEKVYEVCLCHELRKRDLQYQRQIDYLIEYDGIRFEVGLRLDVLVEDLIVCELKAVELMIPVYQAQLGSYLKLSGKHPGFLINFNVPLIKNGIKRTII